MILFADVAEREDAQVLKTCESLFVWVRVPSSAVHRYNSINSSMEEHTLGNRGCKFDSCLIVRNKFCFVIVFEDGINGDGYPVHHMADVSL